MHLIGNTIVTLSLKSNVIKSLKSIESVEFTRLRILDLQYNNISHLRPEILVIYGSSLHVSWKSVYYAYQ